MDQITVSFPGLGIDEFQLNKIALTLFGKVEIRWYGLIITTGIILAVLYCAYRSAEVGITKDDLLDMALYTVIFGVLGARLYYVLMTIGVYPYKSLLDVIAIWEGGLAIYGGVIGGSLAICIYCRLKKIPMLRALDMAAPAVMIGQFMGRWGNFFNGEAYGYEVPEGSPLYFLRMGLIPNINSSSRMEYFHPTFLYESVWNIIVSQVGGFVCFALCGTLLIVGLVNARRRALAGEAYESCYAKCTGKLSITKNEKETAEKSEQDNTETEAKAEDKEKNDGTEN